jgi:hypothetical protein
VKIAVAKRPIFWQQDEPRSQLNGAMRKSRQPHCVAAISKTAAMKTPKPLEAGWNFSRAIFRASSPAGRGGSRNRPAWHEVEQGVPDA